jgi:hypothetical protein
MEVISRLLIAGIVPLDFRPQGGFHCPVFGFNLEEQFFGILQGIHSFEASATFRDAG